MSAAKNRAAIVSKPPRASLPNRAPARKTVQEPPRNQIAVEDALSPAAASAHRQNPAARACARRRSKPRTGSHKRSNQSRPCRRPAHIDRRNPPPLRRADRTPPPSPHSSIPVFRCEFLSRRNAQSRAICDIQCRDIPPEPDVIIYDPIRSTNHLSNLTILRVEEYVTRESDGRSAYKASRSSPAR